MKNEMLSLDSEALGYLLLDYYSKFYNDNTLTIFSKIDKNDENKIKIKLKRNIKINNFIRIIESEIEEEEIISIINEKLANHNYKIDNIVFRYLPSGTIDTEPYFTGVDLYLKKEKEKQKTL